MFPLLLPWLALLLLLALKLNRALAAWWIWGAVLGGLGIEFLLRRFGIVPSQVLGPMTEAMRALSFGMAALWLLSGYLAWKHRFLTLLAMLGVLLAFVLGTCLAHSLSGGFEAVITGVVGGMGALVIAVSLTFTGLICRKRYRPLALFIWSLLLVAVVTSLTVAPFFVAAMLGNPGAVHIGEFFQSLAMLGGINLGVVVLYLGLSFTTGFYRERLKGLLHIGEQPTPPVIAPSPALELTEVR